MHRPDLLHIHSPSPNTWPKGPLRNRREKRELFEILSGFLKLKQKRKRKAPQQKRETAGNSLDSLANRPPPSLQCATSINQKKTALTLGCVKLNGAVSCVTWSGGWGWKKGLQKSEGLLPIYHIKMPQGAHLSSHFYFYFNPQLSLIPLYLLLAI